MIKGTILLTLKNGIFQLIIWTPTNDLLQKLTNNH